jgi:F420H(2)-dependent quinone reductase
MPTSTTSSRPAKVPPRWVVRSAWAIHRAIYRLTGGRSGLSRPRPGHYGMLRLRTVGRRTGKERGVIVAYYLDGDAYIVIAMNGWAPQHPAWLHNLRAEPRAIIDTLDGKRRIIAREAHGEERQRLWDGYKAYSPGAGLDEYSVGRPVEAPVVVLDPVG